MKSAPKVPVTLANVSFEGDFCNISYLNYMDESEIKQTVICFRM